MKRVKLLSFWWRSLLPLAVIASVILPSLGGLPMARASSYSCDLNSQTFGHCYGVNRWDGNVQGAFTYMSVPVLVRPTGGRNTAEMWLSTDSSMVEIGIANGFTGFSGYNPNVNYYYWADLRPGSTYSEHPLIAPPAADRNASLNIYKSTTAANEFDGSINSDTYYFGGLRSVANTMSPTHIQIGTEIIGSSGGSTPSTFYAYNEWQGTTGGAYSYQNNPGTFPFHQTSDFPPTQSWVTVPAPGNSGGRLVVSCAC